MLATFAVLAATLLTVPLQPTGASSSTQRTVFDHTGSQTASQYFSPTLNQPSDYTSPVDYSRGRVYIRLDVLDKPSDAVMIPFLCFWRHTENVKFKYETCVSNKEFAFSGEGVVWIDAGTPSKWWKKNGQWDWSVPASLGRIMMKDPVTGKLWVTGRCGTACYPGADIDEHVPVKFGAEVIFVGAGSELSPPASWRSECPSAWSSNCADDSANPAEGPVDEESPSPAEDPIDNAEAPVFDGPEYVAAAASLRSPTVTAVRDEGAILTTWTSVAGAADYKFRWEEVGGVRRWDRSTSARSRILSGLDPSKAYVVAVRAKVSGTWRPWTMVTVPAASDGSDGPGPVTQPPPVDEPAPPDAPDPVPGSTGPVTKTGNGKTTPTVMVSPLDSAFTVAWEPLPKAPLYQFKYREPGHKPNWSRPSSELSKTVTGLKNGTEYTISVRAYVRGEWRSWTKLTASPGVGPAAGEPADEPAPVDPNDEPAPGTTEEPAPAPAGDGSEHGGHDGNHSATGGWVKVADEAAVFPNDRSRTRYAFFDPDDNPDPSWGASRIGFGVDCDRIGVAQIDPIVNPGVPQSAHLHEFFGNPRVTPDTSTQSLIDVPASEIPCTDRNDKSAYWTPAVYQDGVRVNANHFKAYYKSTTSDVEPMPLGLRMIAGDNTSTENQSRLVGGWVGAGKHSDTNTFGKNKMIEFANPAIDVSLRINFPNCWDGVHLDSPDHKSHMAYFDNATKSCPASHPVKIAQLTTFTRYAVSGGDGLSLASGEWYTFHQDFWNGWSPDHMADLTDECIVAGMNCRIRASAKLQKLGQYYDYVPG